MCFLHPTHKIHNGQQNGPKIQVRQYSVFSPRPPRGLSMSASAWAFRPKPPLYGLNLRKSPIKNYATLFGSCQVGSSTGSNITRLHKVEQISHLETSLITNINRNPPKTTPHPCNSSSCPRARRPTKAARSFSFLIMTPLVNMSAGFLDPQIFSSITSLSSTR